MQKSAGAICAITSSPASSSVCINGLFAFVPKFIRSFGGDGLIQLWYDGPLAPHWVDELIGLTIGVPGFARSSTRLPLRLWAIFSSGASSVGWRSQQILGAPKPNPRERGSHDRGLARPCHARPVADRGTDRAGGHGDTRTGGANKPGGMLCTSGYAWFVSPCEAILTARHAACVLRGKRRAGLRCAKDQARQTASVNSGRLASWFRSAPIPLLPPTLRHSALRPEQRGHELAAPSGLRRAEPERRRIGTTARARFTGSKAVCGRTQTRRPLRIEYYWGAIVSSVLD